MPSETFMHLITIVVLLTIDVHLIIANSITSNTPFKTLVWDVRLCKIFALSMALLVTQKFSFIILFVGVFLFINFGFVLGIFLKAWFCWLWRFLNSSHWNFLSGTLIFILVDWRLIFIVVIIKLCLREALYYSFETRFVVIICNLNFIVIINGFLF